MNSITRNRPVGRPVDSMRRVSIYSSLAIPKMYSLARIALAGLFCVLLSVAAFAKSDPWVGCRSADPDARIAGCSEIIARGGKESKRNRIVAYVNRGETYQAKNDLDRAIADYDKALSLDKKLAAVYGDRARAYRARGDLDKALADFNEAVRLEPNSASAHVDRGGAHQAIGDIDQAITDYDEAIKLDPRLAGAHDNRGLAFHAKGDFDKAIADFSKAIELDPNFANAFLNRANAYRGKRDLEHAKGDLEAALRLNPQLDVAKKALDDVSELITRNAAVAPISSTAGAPVPAPVTMTSDRWIVTLLGLALNAFIVWFFWLKRVQGTRAAEMTGGFQEAMILVKGGYTPDTIIVRHGRPVRLNFRREETASCSDKVIFADFQKSADLPTGQTVTVELLPKEAGEFGFGCPMGMFRGKLIVE